MRKYLIALLLLLIPIWLYGYVDTKDGVAITSNTDMDGASTSFASLSGVYIVDGGVADYPGEPDNRVAVWEFEDSPGFLVDSEGSNTITNSGADQEAATYKQGAKSAAFVLANSDYMTIADADQDAGFPWRNDDGGSIEENFSVTFWIYWASGDLPSDNAQHQYIFTKYNATGDLRVFAIYVTSADQLRFLQGHTNGTAEEWGSNFGTVFTHSTWYHVGVTYDNSTKTYRGRIWDDIAGAQLAADDTHTFANAIDTRDVPLMIGSRDGVSRYADCIIDELIVYKDVLTVAEIDSIRSLNQSAPGSPDTYYVDKTAGDDANAGTVGSPWEHCPGMNGWTGSTTLSAGDTVYFDSADTWTGSGTPILSVTGGVTYDGATWGAGTRATFQATSTFTYDYGAIDFKYDNSTTDTTVTGFEVDCNEQNVSGIKINSPSARDLTGATKKIENCVVHDVNASGTSGHYAIRVGATGNYDTSDVEILNNTIYNTPYTGLAIYEQYGGTTASNIDTVLVRGNTVYNAGLTSGSAILIKNDVSNCMVELNTVYDSEKGLNCHNDSGTPSPSGTIFRYNISYNNSKDGLYFAQNGSKDIEVYGNIFYGNGRNGILFEYELNGTISAKIYNNTFYNNTDEEILIKSSSATFSVLEIKNNAIYSSSGDECIYDTDGDITAHNNNSFEDGGAGNVVYTNGSTYTEGTVIGSYEATAQVGDPSFKDTANLPTGFSGTFGTDMEPNNDGLSATIGDLIENGADLGADSSIDQYGIAGSPARAGTWDIGAYEYVAP